MADTQKPPETPKEIKDKTIYFYGAVGGFGSVCTRLLGIQDDRNSAVIKESINSDLSIQAEPDWIPFINSPFVLLELLLYTLMSIFLGAISGFILINMGGISTNEEHRKRCIATAMLFGLFFPTSIQMLKQNIDSEAQIQYQRKAVVQLEKHTETLKIENKEITNKNNGLAENNLDIVTNLTSTNNDKNAQEDPNIKEAALDSLIFVFENSDDPIKRKEIIQRVAEIGMTNAKKNPDITGDVKKFLAEISDGNSSDELKRISENALRDISTEEAKLIAK